MAVTITVSLDGLELLLSPLLHFQSLARACVSVAVSTVTIVTDRINKLLNGTMKNNSIFNVQSFHGQFYSSSLLTVIMYLTALPLSE